MHSRRIERVRFQGPAGMLEGLLQVPNAPPRVAAVACHPHPLHGGTMHGKVVYRVARAVEDSGAIVLRFNFRGVGASDGEFDGGRGEQADLGAALAFLRGARGGGLPTLLAGFSFGAVVSARAAAGLDADALLLVGAPGQLHEVCELSVFPGPVGVVQGDRDEHGPLEPLRAYLDGLPGPTDLRVVEGAGHFFAGREAALSEAVGELVQGQTLGPALAGGLRTPRSPAT